MFKIKIKNTVISDKKMGFFNQLWLHNNRPTTQLLKMKTA